MKSRRYFLTHADRRAYQRWGLYFDESDHRAISDRIENLLASRRSARKYAVELGRQSSHSLRGVYAVRHRGAWLPIVYSRRDRVIVTVLPRRVLRRYGFKPPLSFFDRMLRWIPDLTR